MRVKKPANKPKIQVNNGGNPKQLSRSNSSDLSRDVDAFIEAEADSFYNDIKGGINNKRR